MELGVMLFRLIGVFVLSSCYGFVRQRQHKPIGFGTYIFVAVGACGLSLVSRILPIEYTTPLLAAIVTGIGFLGAGALIKGTDKVTGFTSAASIWLFAIFGLIVGLGLYQLGLLMYGTACLVMGIDHYLERKSIGAYQKKIVITTNKLISTSEFDKAFFSSHNHRMLSIEVNKSEEKIVATFLVEGTKEEINNLSKQLLHQPWFVSCKVE